MCTHALDINPNDCEVSFLPRISVKVNRKKEKNKKQKKSRNLSSGNSCARSSLPDPPAVWIPSLPLAPPTPLRSREAPALRRFVPRGDPSSRRLWRPPWRRAGPEERPGWAGGLQPREAEAGGQAAGEGVRAGTPREARCSVGAPAAHPPLLASAPAPAADMAGGHCGSFAAAAASSGEIVQLNVGGTR